MKITSSVHNSKMIYLITLLFVFGISLVYGMKCMGLRQVMELDLKSFNDNHYNIYDADAVLDDYEVIDRWNTDTQSSGDAPIDKRYAYFHIKLKSGDIISVKIAKSRLVNGMPKGQLRGDPMDLSKEEMAVESRSSVSSNFIFLVKHGNTYYVVSGVLSLTVSIASVVLMIVLSRKYNIHIARSIPRDEYFDEYDE